MKRHAYSIFILFLGLGIATPQAQALVSKRLDMKNLSTMERAMVTNFVNQEVRADFAEHFEERVAKLAEKANASQAPALSPETRAVLLKGAYLTLASHSPLPLNEAVFNKSVGSVLNWLAEHQVMPQAITIGAMSRKTIGAGLSVGGNAGVEANFYIDQGRLMMSNYHLVGAQVGVGGPTSLDEIYVALCFGACYGGDPNGWYLGFDGEISGGLGVGFFLEVGVDVSDAISSWFTGASYKLQDLYEASTAYVGFGISLGIGENVAGNLYHYGQFGTDVVLANPGQAIRPAMIPAATQGLF